MARPRIYHHLFPQQLEGVTHPVARGAGQGECSSNPRRANAGTEITVGEDRRTIARLMALERAKLRCRVRSSLSSGGWFGLDKTVSCPPQRQSARALYDAGLELTEGRSTGVPKIFRAMSQNGPPPPEFEFDEDYGYFMVRLPVHPEARATGAAAAKATGDVGTESAPS